MLIAAEPHRDDRFPQLTTHDLDAHNATVSPIGEGAALSDDRVAERPAYAGPVWGLKPSRTVWRIGWW